MRGANVAPTAIDLPAVRALAECHGFPRIPDFEDVSLFASDVTFQSSLALEAKEIILVEGNLTVEGTLFDPGAHNSDDYGLLLVTGKVSCNALIWGGSPLFAQGGVLATRFAYHNGWGLSRIEAGPLLRTPILLTIDNEVTATTLDVGRVFIRHRKAWPGNAHALGRGALRDEIFLGGTNEIDVLALRKLAEADGSVLVG